MRLVALICVACVACAEGKITSTLTIMRQPEGNTRARATEVTETRDGECVEQVLAPGDQLISCRSHRESGSNVGPMILLGLAGVVVLGLVVYWAGMRAAFSHTG